MNVACQLLEVSRRLPDHPAITSEAGTVSYSKLAERVARLAGALQDTLGAPKGQHVALYVENCAEFFEVLFATWTAGLCAVPINAKLHPKEVAYIVERSGARLLFATPALAGSLAAAEPGLEPRIVVTAGAAYRRMLRGAPIAPLHASAADPAWLFFTSGTTGRPKGAVLTHRALLFMSQAYYADIDFVDERDTKIHAAPLSHASGLYGLPHLFKGAHHVIPAGHSTRRRSSS